MYFMRQILGKKESKILMLFWPSDIEGKGKAGAKRPDMFTPTLSSAQDSRRGSLVRWM